MIGRGNSQSASTKGTSSARTEARRERRATGSTSLTRRGRLIGRESLAKKDILIINLRGLEVGAVILVGAGEEEVGAEGQEAEAGGQEGGGGELAGAGGGAGGRGACVWGVNWVGYQ